MLDALNQIVGFFQSVFDWFVNMIESTAMAFSIMAESAVVGASLIGFVPTVIGSAITIFVCIFTIKFIVNR